MNVNNLNDFNNFIKTIRSNIEKVHSSGVESALIIYIYVLIDTMAYLSMKLGKDKNNKKDFIKWVEQYFHTMENQNYHYDANDVYGARCAKLHAYSSYSEYIIDKNCKLYGYHDGSEHIYNSTKSEKLVLISVPRLKNDFQNTLKSFAEDVMNDKTIQECVLSRIGKVCQEYNSQELLLE